MAGVFVNSIDMDDFQGSFCNQGKLNASLDYILEVWTIKSQTMTRLHIITQIKVKVKQKQNSNPLWEYMSWSVLKSSLK